jgi:hypothetical protein
VCIGCRNNSFDGVVDSLCTWSVPTVAEQAIHTEVIARPIQLKASADKGRKSGDVVPQPLLARKFLSDHKDEITFYLWLAVAHISVDFYWL